jgi:hypothetical protein
MMAVRREEQPKEAVKRQLMMRKVVIDFPPLCMTPDRCVDEQAACCGADGPNDYIRLRQPLPIECRDTVTGHAFANGCVNEVTWYLEDKSVWAAALAMSLAMIHVRVLESLLVID